ncbi:MAG: major capsid protein [Ruminococcus sp.]|nr:major capsid protein [Ruminococcus sp.]
MKLTDVFTSAAIAAAFNTYAQDSNRPPLLGQSFFPPRKKAGLDLKFIKGSKGAPVALRASAFDTMAPVRDRIGINVLNDQMPFFKDSYLIKEEDRQQILRAADSNDPYARAVLSHIYDDTNGLIYGAEVVPERMIWQLLSAADGHPRISISINGEPKEFDYDPDNSFQENNYTALTGAKMWTNYANATPIEDMETAADTIRKKTGVAPAYAVMTTKTLNDIKQCKSVQGYIIAAKGTGVARITKESVKELIRSELKMEVIVYDNVFCTEVGGTVQKYIPDNVVSLLSPGFAGYTWFGTAPAEADKNADIKCDVTIVDTGIAVEVVSKSDPHQTQILASEIVLPSFEGIDNCYILRTAT